jgi:uncharacterized protein YraI
MTTRWSNVRRMIRSTAVSALIVSLFLPALVSLAQNSDETTVEIVVAQLNVRSGAGTGYGVLRVVTAGDTLRVVGQAGNCAWLQVVDGDGNEGWVSGSTRYVKLSQPCATISASPASVAASNVAPNPTPAAQASAPVASSPVASAVGPLSGKLAYPMGREGRSGADVYVYDLARQQVIAKIEDAHQPQFLGDRLFVAGDRVKRDGIWRMSISGEQAAQISSSPEAQQPAPSPSGQGMVYWQQLAKIDADYWGKGYSMIPTKVNERQVGVLEEMYWQADISAPNAGVPLAFGTVTLGGHYPMFLDDGRVAYSGCNRWAGAGNCGIYVTNLSGGKPVAVTDQPPDRVVDTLGSQLLFSSNRSGNWEVYRVQADGSDLVQLTNHPGFDGPAAFSPDGRRIAFVSNRDGAWAIYLMNNDGSNLQKLLDAPTFGKLDPRLLTEQRISWAP